MSYSIRSVPPSELCVALRCEADRAEREHFPNVAARQRALALHIENAGAWARANRPGGYRVEFSITVDFVPDVIPTLRPEHHHT